MLNIYCKAIGMEVNMLKSTMLFTKVEEEVKTQVIDMIAINHYDREHGIKYLGFNLKQND
jgi:hypothetical protein